MPFKINAYQNYRIRICRSSSLFACKISLFILQKCNTSSFNGYHIQRIFLEQQIPAVLYFLMTVLLRVFAPIQRNKTVGENLFIVCILLIKDADINFVRWIELEKSIDK